MTQKSIPPLEVLAPDGRRAAVHPGSWSDTVADLARAVGLPPGTCLAVDGVGVAPRTRLVDATRLRVGSSVTLDHEPDDEPHCEPGEPMPIEPPADGAGRVVVAVTQGPSCTGWIELPVGRHGVGRSPHAPVVVSDADVELHHGVIDVGHDAAVTFTQLTGRVPARVAERRCRIREPVHDGEEIVLGASRIVVRIDPPRAESDAGGCLVRAADEPWRATVQRAPVPAGTSEERALQAPPPVPDRAGTSMGGLVGAGVGAIGAIVMAVVVGQPMFALFGLLGAVAAGATWAVGAVTARRARHRALIRHDADLAAFLADLERLHDRRRIQHLDDHRTIVDALADADTDDGRAQRLWERRVDADHPLRATVGVGTCRFTVALADDRCDHLAPDLLAAVANSELLVDVPAPVSLEPGAVVAVRGHRAATAGLVRSLVVQLAATTGPADWRLLVISPTPERWEWATWLPHAAPDAGPSVVRADDGRLGETLESAGVDRQVVIVLDNPALLSVRTGPLRRFLATSSAICITRVPARGAVPAACSRVLTIGTTGAAHWSGAIPQTDDATGIRVAGVTQATAELAARRLAWLIDPEDADTVGALARRLSLADIDMISTGLDDRMISRRWADAGTDPAPRAAIGASSDGVVDVDLVRDGPHGLIAGTTGSGKSELLRTLVVGLAAHVAPEHLQFVLIDYKGGSTFDACIRLPHTAGVVTDLDDGLAERALVSLDAELGRREHLLRSLGAPDLTAYRAIPGVDPIPRLVVVIDEFAALAKELPGFLDALIGVAQRGRSLGLHLLLATQRPTGVVNDDIRANTNLRLALRLNDPGDALDVVDDAAPAGFARGLPGRAAMRLGPDDLVVFQAATGSGPVRADGSSLRIEWPDGRRGGHTDEADEHRGPGAVGSVTELDALVAAIDAAANVRRRAGGGGGTDGPRLWSDPLPAVLDTAAVDSVAQAAVDTVAGDTGAHDAVGIIDDPARQTRWPLRWQPDGGNLLLVGSLGSGTTSTMIAVLAAQCRTAGPDACHVYVVDGRGDSLLDALASIAHCGAVVRLHEVERLGRLLRRLAGEIDGRARGAAGRPRVLLFVDGIGPLRDRLASGEHVDLLALLDRIVREGPAVGLATCATTDGVSPSALATPAAQRWVFRLDDPTVGRSLGLRCPAVAADRPGRMRIVECGREAQVAHGAAGLADLDGRRPGIGPRDVATLPEFISAIDLARLVTSRCAHGRAVDGRDDERRTADGRVADGRVAAGRVADGRTPDGRDPEDRAGSDHAADHLAADGVQRLVVGLGSDDLEPATLIVPHGDHVFIAGAARTGRSTALAQVVGSWSAVHRDGVVVTVSRSSPLDPTMLDDGCTRPVLIAVDDADRIDDPHGDLAAAVAGRWPDVMVVAAARLDAVRVAYGHWVREVARSRCGLILTAPGEVDGELLGATLPRRTPIAARPGLAWLIDGRGHRLVQVAGRLSE